MSKGGEASPMEENNKPKEKMTLALFWKEWRGVLLALAIVFVVCKLVLQLAWVPSGSMETTLPTRTLIVGWRLSYLVADPVPERGEIVTFWSDELDELLVKRVIGLPGDTVTFADGYVYVNGERLNEWYLQAPGTTECDKTFTVPEGCFLPMGDNRTGSFDARGWANPYIPVGKLQARTLLAVSFGKDHAWQGVHWMIGR